MVCGVVFDYWVALVFAGRHVRLLAGLGVYGGSVYADDSYN